MGREVFGTGTAQEVFHNCGKLKICSRNKQCRFYSEEPGADAVLTPGRPHLHLHQFFPHWDNYEGPVAERRWVLLVVKVHVQCLRSVEGSKSCGERGGGDPQGVESMGVAAAGRSSYAASILYFKTVYNLRTGLKIKCVEGVIFLI